MSVFDRWMMMTIYHSEMQTLPSHVYVVFTELNHLSLVYIVLK